MIVPDLVKAVENGKKKHTMNQRIRSLADEAEEWNADGDKCEVNLAKFAQLIVRECISMADKESVRYSDLDQEYCSMAMDNYRELVRKHFGVEE